MAPKRMMRDDWLNDEDFSPWLTGVVGHPEKALCNLCNKQFNAEISTIRRHKVSSFFFGDYRSWLLPVFQSFKILICQLKFLINLRHLSKVFFLLLYQQNGKIHIINEEHCFGYRKKVKQLGNHHVDSRVNIAAIFISSFITKHKLPFTITDKFFELCRVIFPDSAIAQNLYMENTKCTEIIKNMNKWITNELVDKLKTHRFSVTIEDYIDLSATECLTVIVKYYDFEANVIKSGRLELINVYDKECAECAVCAESTLNRLYNLLLNTLSVHQIPLENFIGFAAERLLELDMPHNKSHI